MLGNIEEGTRIQLMFFFNAEKYFMQVKVLERQSLHKKALFISCFYFILLYYLFLYLSI